MPTLREASLVDGQLLPQGEVFEGEVAVAAAQDREEPEHVEQEGDHRAGFSPDQGPLGGRTAFWRRTRSSSESCSRLRR